LKRREFITLLGGAAVWPLDTRAEPAAPLIGFLHVGSPGPGAEQAAAFRQGLAESGSIVGQNVTIEYRWAEGRYDRLPNLAQELVQRRVDLLATGGGPAAALAAKAATTSIPIVFVSGADPVKFGLVASLNRPGGMITGAVFFQIALAAKRLQLLREFLPHAVIALLTNPNNPESGPETTDAQAAARSLGLTLHVQAAKNEREIDAAFANVRAVGANAVVMGSDPYFFSCREQVAELARAQMLPVVGTTREYATAGCLASYGNSIPDAYRWMGVYAGRILKGVKPADLPVVQSTRFELVINRKVAKSLGLDIPPTLLALADEVIE